MVRKSKAKRSVNAVGVKKHKVSGRLGGKDIFERLEKLLPRKYVKALYKLAELLFHLVTKICCDLNLIPISIDCDKRLAARKSKLESVTHYSVLALQIARLMYIFLVTMSRVFSKVMNLTTFFCLAYLMAYTVGFGVSLSLLLRPNDTVQLINTTPIILSFYPRNGKVVNMFQNPKNTIFVLACAGITVGGPLLFSGLGVIIDEFPVSLYHIVECVTGRPQSIPYLLWKLCYWPLELLMFLHAITLAGFACMILSTLPNVVMACTREMRKIRVASVESWEELRRKYYQLQVFLCLCNSWIKFMIVPGILTVSSSIIVAMYITLRHTDIPILVYLGIASIGFTLVILMFWFGFEVITFIQSTEDIVGTLNNKDEPYFLELSAIDRLYLAKYGKSTRPAIFDIGDFTDYSVGVPINIWDEILNQLLVLLTF